MFGTAYAQGQGAAGSGGWGGIILILLTFIIFYFLLIRPQQKKEKQRQNMINNLKNGDKVITTSGIYGVVTAIKEEVITVKIASNTNVDFVKNAIQMKVP